MSPLRGIPGRAEERMNHRYLIRLWADEDLARYIRIIDRRHFSCKEDQQDAFDQAWEEITNLPGRPRRELVVKKVYRAINNFYDRERRRRQRCVNGDGNINGKKFKRDGNG